MRIKRNKIKQSKNSSLLTIQYHGLAVSCFSEKSAKSTSGYNETAILRTKDHQLRLYLINQSTNEEKELAPNIPLEKVEIEIKALENPKIAGFEKHISKKSFTRKVITEDPNDLRWIPNIEGQEFHNKKISCLKKIHTPLTRMIIQNALFFCNQKSGQSLKKAKGIWLKDDELLADSNEKSFGRVGFEMGANIEADKVSIKITQNGEIIENTALDNSHGHKYLLKIENLCPESNIENEGRGDFTRYYQVFDAGENGFDLLGKLFAEEKIKPNEQKGESSSRIEFCGMVISGERTNLIDLFQASST